jgi:urocanate hydratase
MIKTSRRSRFGEPGAGLAAVAATLLLGACTERDAVTAENRVDTAADRAEAAIDRAGDRAEALVDKTVGTAGEAADGAGNIAARAGERLDRLADRTSAAAEKAGDELADAGRALSDRDEPSNRQARP